MGVDVVIAKQNTIVVAPVVDLRRVAAYDMTNFMEQVQQVGRKVNNIDMVATVSKLLAVESEEAKKMLQSYNLPYSVSSESEKQKVLNYLRAKGATDDYPGREARND